MDVAPAIGELFLYHWNAIDWVDVALEVKVAIAGAITNWLNGLRVINGSCGPCGKTVKVAVAL